MEQPRIRLGNGDVWLELARIDANSWRVVADWTSWLTADFTADLDAEEVVDFTERMLLRLNAPWAARFRSR